MINGRAKGMRFQAEVAAMMREIYPEALSGVSQYRGGHEEPDVKNCGPWHIECKRGRQPNIRAALKQAEEQKAAGAIPIAVCKGDRDPITVTMRWDTFFTLALAFSRISEIERYTHDGKIHRYGNGGTALPEETDH